MKKARNKFLFFHGLKILNYKRLQAWHNHVVLYGTILKRRTLTHKRNANCVKI
jgi:hypothetical protein